MSKQKSYDVAQPSATHRESKHGRKERARREKKFRDAVFSYTPEQMQNRFENLPRHTRFDDARMKGGRSAQERQAIRDAEQ